MTLRVEQKKEVSGKVLSMRCPACRHQALMQPVNNDIEIGDGFAVGHRVCPHAECHCHVFVILRYQRLLRSYPAEVIDFDSTNVPDRIVSTFSEALHCHSIRCFTAAAIMIRRTLEELCADRNAKGKDLKARIADLRTQIVLPTELLDAMDELRILGNDAAHIEAKEYAEISQDEILVAIECTKEIIKGLYQLSTLLDKLRGLKAKPKQPNA